MSKRTTLWTLPWRYGLFLLACISMVPLARLLGTQVGVMAGFDIAALLFMATLRPFFSHDTETMRAHAREGDANRTATLVVTGIVMLVMLVVIASDLKQRVAPSAAQLALILATLVLAWLFSNLVYTFHYAYLFYRDGKAGGDHGGLDVPGKPEPDYWDFAYFAFTLGMTFQTSDIAVTSASIRRVVLFHSLAAFIFNLGVLAFTINILGGG
ncbi:MAG: DUF1345 domain-containing protein [Sphingobium sp.]|nr:DUF1345 domain-containing protein [Sphingobium sp.]